MYTGWYTRIKFIRTIRQIVQRYAIIAFAVIDHKHQVIIKDINSIDEGFDHMAAEKGIRSVAFCEPAEEKQNTIAIHELRLGKAERFTGDAESFGGGLQLFQFCDSAG